jgi:hypothetical protein
MKIPNTWICIVILVLGLIAISGCGGSTEKTTGTKTSVGSEISGTPTHGSTSSSGSLRNENWLIGTWEATVPKTDPSYFYGKKARLNLTGVNLISNEKIQGNPTGQFAYTGSIVWDVGGSENSITFSGDNWKQENVGLTWGYSSPGTNQFVENISMRIYDNTFSFELDWGPQISKPGSSYESLSFFGSIQSLDTTNKDQIDVSNMMKFVRTSSVAANTSSKTTTTTSSTTAPPEETTSTTAPASSTGGTKNIWSDIPIYSGAQPAADTGFGLTIQGDPSFPNSEWRFYETPSSVSPVSDFYNKQMPDKGWTKESWLDMGEMQYGSFVKNNETRRCLIYVIANENVTSINILSAAK